MELPMVNKTTNYHVVEYQQDQNMELFMRSCGTQNCLSDYGYPRCARPGYHLHVVLSGKGRYYVGGQCLEVHSGQMFLLKDMEEVYYQADTDDPWHYVWVTYGGSKAKQYLEMAGFTDGVYVLTSMVDITGFMAVVSEILKRQHMRFSDKVARAGLALQFLSLAVESWEKTNAGTSRRNDLTVDDYVAYAVRFIQTNYQRARISDVAEYIGINRTYLTEIFKDHMLMSPQEYLLQVRMDRAKELLRQSSIAINLVAREVGYEDQLSFSKIFKKRFGISPTEFRRSSES